MVNAGGVREWQILVQRPLNDWKIGDYERLLGMLSQVPLDSSSVLPVWSQTKKGVFAVKSSTGSFQTMIVLVTIFHIGRYGRQRSHLAFCSLHGKLVGIVFLLLTNSKEEAKLW